MRVIQFPQGSDGWQAERAAPNTYCASEAAAMMGVSPHMKRNELLHAKKTCSAKEFSDFVQKRVIDKGHEVEAAARPFAEAHIGEDLYRITGVHEVEGLRLLASFDGATMAEDVLWENKLRNAELARAVKAGDLPPYIWAQLEHQCIVSEAERVYFTISDGTQDGTEGIWYQSQPERRQAIIAGWKQFDQDLKDYVPVEAIPAATAAPVKALPAITWKREAGLALTSNLTEYRASALQLVEDSKRKLETDQDFANCEALCKSFTEAEAKIELVKSQVVGEIQDVDKFCRDLTEISDLIRHARLNGEKQVKARKDAIRLEILTKGRDAFAEHRANLNKRIGRDYMPDVPVDFAGAMKNKRTISSLQDAVDTELARAKIAANEIADRITVNMNKLREMAGEHKDLFADTATIVLKPTEDLVTLINYRIDQHKAKEAARLEEERAKIRAEEKAKLEQEDAARKAKEEADLKAKLDAEDKARREADEKVRLEAEELARAQAAAITGNAPGVAPQVSVSAIDSKPAAAPAAGGAVSSQGATLAVPDPRQALAYANTLRLSIDRILADMNEGELILALDAMQKIEAKRPRLRTA